MRVLIHLFSVGFMLTHCGIGVAREFGPEWKKSANGYRMQIGVTVVKFGFSEAMYRIHLDHDFLQITERTVMPGSSVMWTYKNTGIGRSGDKNPQLSGMTPPRIGYADVGCTSDGSSSSRTIHLSKGHYLDLDADGIFDLLVDQRQDRHRQVSILCENRFILVEGSARGLGVNMRDSRSLDGNHYIFRQGGWRLREFGEASPVEDPRPQTNAARVLGPEWTKGKDPITGVNAHLRELTVPVIHDGKSLAIYRVPMEGTSLEIGEFDDNRGFYVSWQKDGRVDVRRKADGSPAWHAVRFPNTRYLDLNGDGILDLLVDYREDAGGQLFILFDNRFTPVKTPTEGVSETLSTAETADGVNYVFSGDKWQAK